MKIDDNMEDRLCKLFDMRDQLAALNASLSEEDMIDIIVGSLPHWYDLFKEALFVSTDKKTPNSVRELIVLYHEKLKAERDSGSS